MKLRLCQNLYQSLDSTCFDSTLGNLALSQDVPGSLMAFGQTQASLTWELQLVPQCLHISLFPILFSVLDFFSYLGFRLCVLIP